MSTQTRDVVIVGGGAAGMAAAWQLRDMDIALLDENLQLGGRLKSFPRGDYWLNVGGHIFPADEGTNIRRMIADLGLGTIAITGSLKAMSFGGKVYASSRIEAYPFTLPLSLRDRVQLAIAGLKIRWKVRSYLAASRARPGEPEAQRRRRESQFESRRTFRDLLGRLPAPVDAIFQTAARRSPGEMDQLAAGAGILLFASNWSTVGALVNLRGGSGRIGEAVARRLGERVVLGARVVSVEQDGDRALVHYDTPEGRSTIVAKRVIVATPAPVTVAIVPGLPEDVQRSLRSVTYGPFVCMAALTDETGPMPWDDLYAILTPGMAFNMLFNHANALRDGSRRTPGGSMMCYAGGQPGAEMLELPDDEVVRRFTQDLDRVFPGLSGRITETIVQRWPLGNCWRTPTTDLDAVLAYSTQESKVIQLAGDYFGELGGTIEYATRSGIEAARRVAAALGAQAG